MVLHFILVFVISGLVGNNAFLTPKTLLRLKALPLFAEYLLSVVIADVAPYLADNAPPIGFYS
jgi:hypothetical protein